MSQNNHLSAALSYGVGHELGLISKNALSKAIGHGVGFIKDHILKRAIAHGIVSGIMNPARGGNFRNGFMSTFFSTLAGGVRVGNDWVQGVFQTLVGGTASEIGGGKFANGAVSAAMVYLFNDSAHPGKETMNSLIKKMPRLNSDFERKMFDRYWSSKGDYTLTIDEFDDILSRSHVVKGSITENSIGITLYHDSKYDFAIGGATLYYSSDSSELHFYDNYNFDPKPWGVRSIFAETATRLVNNEGRYYGASSFEIRY